MKVAVTGATGVLGSSAVPALVAAGHEVVALARTSAKASIVESWGATPVTADLFDQNSLAVLLEGCDAVCNLATRIPVGFRAAFSSSWRENDRLRTQGVRRLVAAARQARVRRVVQESVSFVYADHGDTWIDESSQLEINSATEPACVAESHVQGYQSDLRQGVVLRFGMVIGDDALTRFWLRTVRNGMPIGLGAPEGWVHPLHTDDVGPAVVAALCAPGGVYNVGAEPVRRRDLLQGYADAAGRAGAGTMGPLLRRLTGSRAEPLSRSLRVSSEHFAARTGWAPRRAQFSSSWITEMAESTA
jgi:nucleoside-diphosphate-sugar epimerase